MKICIIEIMYFIRFKCGRCVGICEDVYWGGDVLGGGYDCRRCGYVCGGCIFF